MWKRRRNYRKGYIQIACEWGEEKVGMNIQIKCERGEVKVGKDLQKEWEIGEEKSRKRTYRKSVKEDKKNRKGYSYWVRKSRRKAGKDV
jgi:hypothetical protein